MALQNIALVSAICFLAFVCVNVDAQGAPVAAPVGAPVTHPVAAPQTPPAATPPVIGTPLAPVATPPAAMGPEASGPAKSGPASAPVSGVNTVVPSVAFTLLGAAALFF